jgi:5-oxoprolinase (ATP-hydrolysing) subunit A
VSRPKVGINEDEKNYLSRVHKKTMFTTDINCDMGEGIGNDAQLMPFISSANIACGYHAGDAATMQQTVQLAIEHHVAIGAHPSYNDVANFGRLAISLPPNEVYEIVCSQIKILATVCAANNTVLHHVKPHGALYNTAVKDLPTAQAIALAVKDCNPNLILYGLPGTFMQQAAKEAGISFLGEAFADRTYQPDGTLTQRQQAGALINNTADAVKQALQLVQTKTVTTITGQVIPVDAGTICIHGDGVYAPEFAKAIHAAISNAGITINKNEQR